MKARNVASLLLVGLVALAVALGGKWAMARQAERGASGARAFAAAASTDRLIEGLQSRLRSRPQEPRAYSILGSAYLQKARETGHPAYYGLAQEAMEKALALDPQDPEAMVGMGALALSRHQFHEALEWGERARQAVPHKPQVYGVMGDAYAELGRYEEAFATYQRMVDLRPDLGSYSRVSYARELSGEIPGAIEAMKRAAAAGGPSGENASWVRAQLGNLYFRSGDLAGAEAEYRAALRAFPRYIHGLGGLGRTAAARGEYTQAIGYYQQVVDSVPLPEYVIALGDVYAAAGRAQDAAKMYALVRVQQQLYRANGVNTDLEMALFDADHDQNLPEALAQARQEYRRRPSIWAADVLAWTLYKNGRLEEALAASQDALRLGTQDALLLFHAAMISYGLEQQEQALAYLEQALAINPHFSVLYQAKAQRALEELRARTAGPGASEGRQP